mmetsp:Transcript_116074/g.335240  ORF Transcript_116074/g.335240 Transcript_116074/m.335240 type:complete len:284 (-) Transcript_116074:542-1393(-)
MSLKEKRPTSWPLSTTKAAFLRSAITMATSRTLVWGSTTVPGLPSRRLRSVGDDLDPKACAIRGPSKAWSAAACSPTAPCALTAWRMASLAMLSVLVCAFSSFEMASLRHLAISRMPTTPPSSSTTGRCRKRFSTMVDMASIAGSDLETQDGFFVMTFATAVDEASRCRATTRLVTSVSVKIPCKLPSGPTIKDASPRLPASIWVTASTESSVDDKRGFFGRNLETGRVSFALSSLLFFDRTLFERLPPVETRPLTTEAMSETSSKSRVLEKIDLQPSAPPQP